MILDLCGGTGSWSQPYRDKGVHVIVVDTDPVLEPDICQDIRDLDLSKLPPPVGILAAPPCTHFSNASSRNWPKYDQQGDTERSLDIVQACLKIISVLKPRWWALENPRGRLIRTLGPPAWSFRAWEYGDSSIKHTLIWGTARRPPSTDDIPIRPPANRMGGSGRKVKTERSRTPQGFARAFAAENKGHRALWL